MAPRSPNLLLRENRQLREQVQELTGELAVARVAQSFVDELEKALAAVAATPGVRQVAENHELPEGYLERLEALPSAQGRALPCEVCGKSVLTLYGAQAVHAACLANESAGDFFQRTGKLRRKRPRIGSLWRRDHSLGGPADAAERPRFVCGIVIEPRFCTLEAGHGGDCL